MAIQVYYREEMDEKLAKRKAFDERKASEKVAATSTSTTPREPARDLRYEDNGGGDFNVFERLGGLFGRKKEDEE